MTSKGLLMAEQKKNLWAQSADPAARAKAYKQRENYQSTKEVRTANVQKESFGAKVGKKLKGGK